MIENLMEKSERKVAALEKTKRTESFSSKCNKQKGRENLDVLQRFRSNLNEFNLTSRGERKGFALALERRAEIIGSELL